MQNTYLRIIKNDDLDEMHGLEVIAWGNMAATLDEMERRMAADPKSMYGAFIEGKMVGSVVFVETKFDFIFNRKWSDYLSLFGKKDKEADCLYIVSFTACPSAPRGVGKMLLDFACQISRERGLKYLAYGSRVPGFRNFSSSMDITEYIGRVKAGEIVDTVLSLAKIMDFAISEPIEEYFNDEESLNYGVIVFTRTST